MITRKEIDQVTDKAKGLKALVIGDAMLDKYIFGSVDRISPEAPVPILSHQRTEIKSGGAANVALNLAAWGCQTTLIGLTGQDDNAKALISLLEQQHIDHHLFQCNSKPTTVKTRVVASSHHMLRIDEESTDYLYGDEEDSALTHITDYIKEKKPDLIIFEDYNKGFLTAKIITSVIRLAREMGVFIAVDPKDKNYFKYEGVDLFKPNHREASTAALQHLQLDDLQKTCREWRNQMNIETIAVTLGGHGLYLQNKEAEAHVVPDRAIDVVDVCGAGDAVICALALSMMSGLSLKSAGALSNLTGAYVCSHSGVVTVDVNSIYQWIA